MTKDCPLLRTIHWPQREESQKKRNKNCIKKPLSACHVHPPCWSDMAADRDAWRHSIFKVINEFEQARINAQKDERTKRKARVASNTTPDVTLTCGHCSRHCLSCIGLVSHELNCSQRGQTTKHLIAKSCHYYYYHKLNALYANCKLSLKK